MNTMPREDLLSKAREMAEAEKRYAEELRRLAGSLRHPVLRALLEGVASDSEKHSVFYGAIAEILERHQPMISEEDYEAIASSIEAHIETEEEMASLTKKLADETRDPRLKLILLAIHEDEEKHHKLLLDLRDKLASPETFTEKHFWEAVWRDSPWHGSPGG